MNVVNDFGETSGFQAAKKVHDPAVGDCGELSSASLSCSVSARLQVKFKAATTRAWRRLLWLLQQNLGCD